MAEIVEHMGSYFAAAHHEVTAALFAPGILEQQRGQVARAMASGQIVPRHFVDALTAVELGDPVKPTGAGVGAYVNGGRWLGKCPDCGGSEFVDFTMPIFMCCSCWNVANGWAWRPVDLPAEPAVPADDLAIAIAVEGWAIAYPDIVPAGQPTRADVEAQLLARADPVSRSWYPEETLADLVAENEAHGIGVAIDPAPTLTVEVIS